MWFNLISIFFHLLLIVWLTVATGKHLTSKSKFSFTFLIALFLFCWCFQLFWQNLRFSFRYPVRMRRSVLWLQRVRSHSIENRRHSESLRKWVTACKNTLINTLLGFFIQIIKFTAQLGAKSPFFLFSPGSGVTFPWGLEVGVDLCDGFFPLSSFFLPLEELSDPGDFLPSIPFSLGEWWFPLVAAPLSLASSTTRSWSDFSPSLFSVLSLFNFLWSGDPALGLSPGLRELLWNVGVLSGQVLVLEINI